MNNATKYEVWADTQFPSSPIIAHYGLSIAVHAELSIKSLTLLTTQTASSRPLLYAARYRRA